MSSREVRIEEIEVTGHQLVAAMKNLVHQGNIRRVSIRDQDGKTLLEIPLLFGVAGAVVLPVWAAIGALAALVAHCTLVVERLETCDGDEGADAGKPAEGAESR